jgi:1,4-alpha-glucan branching enzyme
MKRIFALLFAGTVLISCGGPTPAPITNPGATIPVTIYFLNGYNMSSPNMWFWKTGAAGSQISSSGTTNMGGYDFIIFKTLAASNTTYGLQFRSGTSYEKALYLFPADRTLTVGTAAIEKFAISYNRQLWDSSLVTKLSNPDNWGMVTNMLGANIDTDGTTVYFSVFAPNSTRARVAGEFTSWATSAKDMYLTPDGKYWWYKMSIASPNGKAYKFILNTDTWTCDPYSKANMYANGNSLIMLTNYSWTDSGFTRPTRTELIIYEVHIKDFTSDSSSGVTASGKYLGVLEKIDYLTNLGINSIEFMPPSEFSDAGYSWGYNTALFFAPESGYASANTGAQVTEMKQMIDGLHNAGIAVIFDMVYNHTSSSENYLWTIDSTYYFDYDNDGDPNNDSTAWGNKVATWRPEVMKLMYDNMKYFMDAFHVDGFRFDSTENMDINSLLSVFDDLITAGYGDRYYICEEFNGSHNSAIQTFNLNNGDYVASWGNGFRNGVWGALFQTSYSGLGNATYHCNDDGWKKPTHVISYTSSHDEGTLAGRWSATKAKIKLAYAHMMTSMGTPMIWMGDEFMRLHYGNYIAGNTDEANNILDWDLATTNADLIAYVSSLVKLRLNNPVLNQNVQNPSGWGWLTSDWANGSIGYQYIGVSGQRDFVILANFYSSSQIYTVAQPGTWYMMCNGTSATNVAPGLATATFPASTNISVPAGTAYIYMSSTVNP